MGKLQKKNLFKTMWLKKKNKKRDEEIHQNLLQIKNDCNYKSQMNLSYDQVDRRGSWTFQDISRKNVVTWLRLSLLFR